MGDGEGGGGTTQSATQWLATSLDCMATQWLTTSLDSHQWIVAVLGDHAPCTECA